MLKSSYFSVQNIIGVILQSTEFCIQLKETGNNCKNKENSLKLGFSLRRFTLNFIVILHTFVCDLKREKKKSKFPEQKWEICLCLHNT